MKRHVEHGALGKVRCSCGATFKSSGKLRAHLAVYEERVYTGAGPRAPDLHQKKKAK